MICTYLGLVLTGTSRGALAHSGAAVSRPGIPGSSYLCVYLLLRFFFPCIGNEQRFSELVNAKLGDFVLGFFGYHELYERFSAFSIHLGEFVRVYLHYMVNVEEDGIFLNQDFQTQSVFACKVCSTVSENISAFL